MAKFEIEAKIGANSAEFERKLKHASAESREFAKNVKENMVQAKEVFGEVAGEAGLGKLVGALGSASAAAAAFGAAIVASVGEGVKEFSKFEDAARMFGNILHDPEAGKQMAEFAESSSGHRGDPAEAQAALRSLLETYGKTDEGIEKAKAKLLELQNVSAETNDSIVGLAESLRRFHSAGEDATAGGTKLLKTMKPLAGMIEEQKKALIDKLQVDENYWGKNSAKGAADLKQIADLKAESNIDFVKHLTGEQLDEMITKQYGPKGPSGGAADARGEDISGKAADLSLNKDKVLKAIGEGAAPSVKKVLDEINEEMPKLTTNAKAFGESLGKLVLFIDSIKGKGPGQAGEEWDKGGEHQQRVLREKFGYYGQHTLANGKPGGPITALEYQMNQNYERAKSVQHANTLGADIPNGGIDLQSQQLKEMQKIEANTGVLKDL